MIAYAVNCNMANLSILEQNELNVDLFVITNYQRILDESEYNIVWRQSSFI